MASLIILPRFEEDKGSLTVLDNLTELLPFEVKRIFFINALKDVSRGGHRHQKTRQAVICISGHCTVYNNDGANEKEYLLDSTDKCLVLETSDWHTMHSFSENAILLVFASEPFDPADYIYEPYKVALNDTL